MASFLSILEESMYLSTYPSKRDGHPPIYLGGEPPLPTYSGWSVHLSTYVGKDGNTSIYCWSTCLVFQYKQRPGFHEIKSPISLCISICVYRYIYIYISQYIYRNPSINTFRYRYTCVRIYLYMQISIYT